MHSASAVRDRPGALALGSWPVVFFAFGTLTTGFTLWLLSRHYLSDAALWSWATAVGGIESDDGSFLRLLNHYPPVQYAVLGLLAQLPGLHSPLLPYLISSLLAAALLTHFALRLQSGGYPRWLTVALPALVLTNPAFLWAASNGNGESLSMLLYYALALAMIELRDTDALRTYLVVAGLLLLLAFTDARNVYLAIALLPVVGLLVQRHVLRDNPVAPKVVLYTPLALVLGIWLVLHWMDVHHAPTLFEEPHAPIGARLSSDHVPWRSGFAGEFGSSAFAGLAWLCLCYPVFLLMLLAPLRGQRLFQVGLVLAIATALTTGLAVAAEFTRSPTDMMVLVLGGLMALLTAGLLVPQLYGLTLVAMLVGNIDMAAMCLRYPATGMPDWTAAVMGRPEVTAHRGDFSLGIWLRDARNVMLDDRSGFGAIAARGDGHGLLLGFSDAFQMDLDRGRLSADWVAVPDPQLASTGGDRINRRFPTLYDRGFAGYSLAYDHAGWRVYRRDTLPGSGEPPSANEDDRYETL